MPAESPTRSRSAWRASGRSPSPSRKQSAAKSWATDLESKFSKGEHADSEAERRTLEDACKPYLKTHPDIASDHERIVKWWKDSHGKRKLAKVTTPWLTEIRDELAAGSYKVGPKDNQTERKSRLRLSDKPSSTISQPGKFDSYSIKSALCPEKFIGNVSPPSSNCSASGSSELPRRIRNCKSRLIELSSSSAMR